MVVNFVANPRTEVLVENTSGADVRNMAFSIHPGLVLKCSENVRYR
jgi:hypothetical protein